MASASTAGTGSDILVLKLSQDAYQGDAEYRVLVDGKQVGDTFTAQALRGSGETDTLTLKGDWGTGEHSVAVEFLNDAWDGSPETDRNLFLEGASYNGETIDGAALDLFSAGAQSFGFTEAGAPEPQPSSAATLSAGTGSDTLVLKLSQDAYQGDAEYRVLVDGKQVGDTFTAQALRGSGETDTLTLKGDWGTGEHSVAVEFLNDAWDGSPETDRNLFLEGASYNGETIDGAALDLFSAGAQSFGLTEAGAPEPHEPQPESGQGGGDRNGDSRGFADMIGVGVHLNYWSTLPQYNTTYGTPEGTATNTPLILQAMEHLGLRHLRVGIPEDMTIDSTKALAEKGYKFNVVMPAASDETLPQQMDAIRPFADSVVSFEGQNEVNLFTDANWNGERSNEAFISYQAALFDAVKTDPELAHAHVYQNSFGGVGYDYYREFGPGMAEHSDAGNLHLYFPDGDPPGPVLDYVRALRDYVAPGMPMAITETNYNTAGVRGTVSEEVQAKYDLNLLMEAADRGDVEKLYFYELFDLKPDPEGRDIDSHFGLFRADGSPKPAADAIGNLVRALEKGGDPAHYQIAGIEDGKSNMVELENADGSRAIAVWAAPDIWDVDAHEEIPAPVQKVTFEFGSPENVAVFDPLQSAEPVATYQNAREVALEISDHPLIVQTDWS